MVAIPGLYDSHQRAVAVRNYYRNPNEQTKRALEQAKHIDQIAMRKFEAIMALPLLGEVYGLYRINRRRSPRENNTC